MKKYLKCLALSVILLITVVLHNAWNHQEVLPSTSQIPKVEVDEEQILRLSKAIQFPTVSRFGSQSGLRLNDKSNAFSEFHSWLRTSYPHVHSKLELTYVNTYSLLYRWPGKNKNSKPILFVAHQDVVPANESSWLHSPYSGKVEEGYIWGRGTIDDKSSMMAIFESVESLLTQEFIPEQDIYLAFGHDEEVGGELGAKAIAALLAKQRVYPSFILDEGGFILADVVPGIQSPVALIGIAEKGYMNITLTANGPPGHSAIPPSASSVNTLAKAITRIVSNPLPAEYLGATQKLFESTSPYMSFNYRLLFSNLWLFKPILLSQLTKSPTTNATVRTTLAITTLNAGVRDNVLPDKATANVNVRLLPGTTPKQVVDHLKSVINDPMVEIEVAGTVEQATGISSVSTTEFDTLKKVVSNVYSSSQVVVAPYLTVNSTDARHYEKLSNNIYRFLPVFLYDEDLKRIHGPNERISSYSYSKMITFYKKLVEDLASSDTNDKN